MSFSPDTGSNRREFFRTAARYVVLGVLGLVAAVTGGKGGLGAQRCVNRGICRGCDEFASCGLPQALSARRELVGGSYETRKKQS